MNAITGIGGAVMQLPRDSTAATTNRSYPLMGLSEWQVRAIQTIAALGSLRQDWDSYGSEPIPDKVLDVATELVRSTNYPFAPVPSVVPVSGGGVQLEWSRGNREFDLYISPDLTIEVMLRVGDDMEEAVVKSPRLGTVLSWLEAA